ncbi:hypothetical protein ACFIQG_21915 [Comamonas odontotermitis]|uniref:DUF7666 domain-containing protein n=1 Tax=Comamonas odontotermitis TaxID=379895 RepID=UPI0036701718
MTTETAEQPILTYKGFGKDLKCRDFQYEIGGTYENEKGAEACKYGFHACEHPLNVFEYYAPAGNRFAVVEQSGVISRHGSDTKVASSKITIKAEIGIPGLVKAAVEYVTSRCKPIDPASPASSTGYRGAASSTGEDGAAMASGYAGKAMGAMGNALFLVHRDDDYKIVKAGAAIVGQNGIKPDVWYSLNAEGEFVEAE